MKFKLFLIILIGLGVKSYAQTINAIEYFVDNDPGIGMASPVIFASGSDISINFAANLNGISDGYHLLFIRSKNSNGTWSLTANQSFYKNSFPPISNVLSMEYFIDNDPGFGLGTSIPISTGIDVTQAYIVNISNLTEGFHIIYFRSKNSTGKWSLTSNNSFYVTKTSFPSNIVRFEYFIDNDPGFGLANNIPVVLGADITKTLIANLGNLTQGNHTLFIRSLDNAGKWSLTAEEQFYFCSILPNVTISGPTSNVICLGSGITLNATGGQSYIWNTGATASSIQAYPNSDSLFSVIAIDALGCSDTANFNVQVDLCTSMEQKQTIAGKIDFYPNPFNKFITIKSNDRINLIEIYGLDGKLLFSATPTSNQLDLSFLPAGGYLIKALNSNQTINNLIIKSEND